MTKDEANRVAQAMQALNGFATTSNMLNTNASWHATWQQLYAQVIREVAGMVDKPAVNTERSTEQKLAKTGAEIAKAERECDKALRKIAESDTPKK